MDKIRAILIEDEPLARENCSKIIRRNAAINLLAEFDTPIEAMGLVKNGEVDLIFSDIQMPEMDGISFLRSLEVPPFTIFITGYPGFALEGFELDVLDYILKPLTEERLSKGIEKARKAIEYRDSNYKEEYIKVKDRNRTLFLRPFEILYVQGWGDYVKIATSDGMIISSYSLKELEVMLPNRFFSRIQRSYIVNITHVGSVDATKVILKTGKHQLPLGLQYRTNFYQRMGIK